MMGDPQSRRRTQASQATAANMGIERIFLKVFIQAPGLGRKESREGKKESSSTGEAKPTAREEKTSKVPRGGRAKAEAKATPMKGAVQGEATATASRPEAKAPVQPCPEFLEARLERRTGNSKKPKRFRARAKSSTRRSQTTGGD